MSEYLVTARKWRPVRFEDVEAQEHVTTTLRNALTTDRLAHAYLFSGPRGVGKTTTARILARAVNCASPVDANPDNTCERCRAILEGRSFDVLEIDGASNRGVEEIRNLRESVRYAPAAGPRKVYIIDEVHMLTKEAFNALLKTLEEPPPHVLFIFATTEIHKVPATILSRCQRFDFRRIPLDRIVANLAAVAGADGVTMDEEAMLMVARKGDGSLRDAQSIFDQVISLCGREVTHEALRDALNIVDTELFFRVTACIAARDAAGALGIVEELVTRGHDLREFVSGLLEHLRNLLVAKTTGQTDRIEAADVYRRRYLEESASLTIPDILRFLRQTGATEQAIRWSPQPRIRLEADLVQMVTLPTAPEVSEVLGRLEDLRKQLGGQPASAPPTPGAPPQRPAPAPVRSAPRPPTPAPVRTASPSPPPTAPPPAPPGGGSPMNPEELRARWPAFIVEVRKQRISLGSVLDAAVLLSTEDGMLRIGCGNEFQISSLRRNKEFLAAVAREVFTVPVRIEMEVHADATGPPPAADAPPPPPDDEHPVVKAIIRELGGEQIQ
jgi:DNA polymerase-3 subunit gamma/tau